jgi:hypothetical protein
MPIYVYERPIFLEFVPAYAGMTYYVDEPKTLQINFTVNDPARAEGYVLYNFTMVDPADTWPSMSEVWMDMLVYWHPSIYEYASVYTGYPQLVDGGRTMTWLFEYYNDTTMMGDGPFNFSDPLMQGYILYEVEYYSVVADHYIDIQITSSP